MFTDGTTMRRCARAVVPLLALALVAVVSLATVGRDVSNDAERVNPASERSITVMPMGDSITGSTGCWRALLWAKLRGTGHKNVDFTGRGIGPECDSIFDDDAVAYSGTRVVDMKPDSTFLKTLRTTGKSARIALMHLGSNDIRDDKSIDEILVGYTTIAGLLRQANPDIVILVAQLIPITTSPMDKDCPQCPDKVRELNEAIPGWAKDMDRKDSPITVVDQHDGFDPGDDTYDGLHPDDSGGRKMADKWFDAIDKVVGDR